MRRGNVGLVVLTISRRFVQCVSTFASDAEWIHSPCSSTYLQSPHRVVCISGDGCGGVWTNERSAECASLTDDEYVL